MKALRRNLSYANVTASLALVVAVAGGTTAIAASMGKNSVTSKSIKQGNVTARDLTAVRAESVAQPGAVPLVSYRADCAGREKLVGGGAQLERATQVPGAPVNPPLQSSYPSGNSWVASPGDIGNLTVYALCLQAKPSKSG